MKIKKYHIYLILTITVMCLVMGCNKDFLERPPLSNLTANTFFNTDAELAASTGGLYNAVWEGSNGATFTAFGDGRGGIFYTPYVQNWQQFSLFSVSNTNGAMKDSWASFYNVIAQANVLISNVKAYSKPAVSDAAKRGAIAEARFMRGVAYSYLVQNWGPIPIITDNLKQGADTTLTRNTTESVWQFAIRDIQYAVKNLPLHAADKSGRLDKYSAEGMLARMYLTYAGLDGNADIRMSTTKHSRNQVYLDSAKYYANDVIQNGGYELMANYPELFLTANNNNKEQLFGLLWVPIGYVDGQVYVGNGFQSQFAENNTITGGIDGWGGGHGASNDYILNLDPLDSIRRKATFMFPGDFYPELNTTGNPPGWREPIPNSGDYGNVVHFKKYIVGSPADNGGKGQVQGTGNNTYIQRLADVYFIYAEAILGNNPSTTDADALLYYNKVRNRAGLESVTSFSREDLLHERRYEFALEGDAWYDLVRLYYYDPDAAIEMINNQSRGDYKVEIKPGTSGLGKVKEFVLTRSTSLVFSVSPATMFLPYPDTELAIAPNLRKEPVPYVFE